MKALNQAQAEGRKLRDGSSGGGPVELGSPTCTQRHVFQGGFDGIVTAATWTRIEVTVARGILGHPTLKHFTPH